MRGSFDALAGAVRRLGLDPVDGHLYLFLNKRRRLAKALWFDGSGWCVLAKRLEAGSFQLPPFAESDSRVEVDGNTFTAIGSYHQTSPGLNITSNATIQGTFSGCGSWVGTYKEVDVEMTLGTLCNITWNITGTKL